MTVLLAGVSGALLVGAAWEAFGALLRLPLIDAIERLLSPARAAGRDGRAPRAPERRRLAAVTIATLAAGGWMLAGPVLSIGLAAGGPAIAAGLVRTRRVRWRRRAARAAGPAARALADALSAGYTLPRAIEVVALRRRCRGPRARTAVRGRGTTGTRRAGRRCARSARCAGRDSGVERPHCRDARAA